MKKKILPVLFLVIASAVAYGSWTWANVWRYQESTDDAYLESDITPLSAKVSGHVVELLVTDHQTVKAGQVLLRLDDTDYRAKLADAKAIMAARNAALSQLDDRIAVQQAMMQQARAGISAAQAELKRSQADLKRSQALVREDYVSRQMLDSRTAEASKAQANVSGSNALSISAQRQLAVLESERDIVTAQLEQAAAQLAVAEHDLAATEIKAPVDGVIGNRAARVGLYARPGQHLLSLVPLPQIWVDANFKETQLTHMRPGQKATIRIDTFPGQDISGHIVSLSPATGAKFSLLPPENATGNFTKVVQRIPVRIALDPQHPLLPFLRPGLSVTATVTIGP